MPYVDQNTPVIQKINLPSGNQYYIADRQIRNVVEALSDTVAGGVSYVIGWDGTDTPEVGNIPEDIVVTYNNTEYTGTLDANNATPGAFYLVKYGGSAPDVYSEYVPVGSVGNKTWQKLGDTQIDLTDIVTGVSLDKQTATVIGNDSTFTVTQPSVGLQTGATAGTGVVSVATGINTASVNGDDITVVTGYENPSSDTFVTSVSATDKKLATTSVTGVTGSTTASLVTTSAQTTADGSTTTSSDNGNIIKGMSVTNGILTFGACTLDTQTTNSSTGTNVTVPVADVNATVVATGKVANSDTNGDTVITAASAGGTASALTGLGSASTDSVLGSNSTISVTANTTNIAATASGAGVAWNNKDSKTVLTNGTSLSVTKGN